MTTDLPHGPALLFLTPLRTRVRAPTFKLPCEVEKTERMDATTNG